ncbi:20268_t:CDS:1, partial [Cetraspora pellucida]
QNENSDIIDPEIVNEVVSSIGNGARRSIKDILQFIVPDLINKEILNSQEPVINLRISGDGRNVGKKMKHVMITFAILDNIDNIHNPDHHYMVVLYPGSEDYKSLDVATTLLRDELYELTREGLIINEIKWHFNLYFSSDWKFLAISLGFNAAN